MTQVSTRSKKSLYLVDVSSLFFRAFYAVRPLTTPSGIPANAIYGFLTMIIKLIKEEKPEAVVFCYDRKEPSFRKDIYPEYKANRTEMPEDLVPQIPYIRKLGEVFGVRNVDILGYEADDIIGSFAKVGTEKGYQVYIVSGDKDFAQLVNDKVQMLDTMKSEKMGPAEVKTKWGIRPDQMMDYLSLVGDSSDNIPGVAGIGPKGAQKLLEDFDTLEGIYKNIDQINSASLKTKLQSGFDSARLSKKLVEIKTDLGNGEHASLFSGDLHWYGVHREALVSLLSELNFKSLEKTLDSQGLRFQGEIAPASSAPGADIQAIVPVASEVIAAVIEKKVAGDVPEIPEHEISISDLQNLLPNDAVIWIALTTRGCSLWYDGKIYFINSGSDELGQLLAVKKTKLCGFDLKEILHLIKWPKENPVQVEWDSRLAGYFLQPGENNEFDRLIAKHLGEIPPDLPTPSQIFHLQWNLEKKLKHLLTPLEGEKILRELDFPLVGILYSIEKTGICLDSEMLKKQSVEIGHDLVEIEKKIIDFAGESFNVASPKQLSQILFEKLKLPPGKKTKTGFSTDNEVLEKLKKIHPIADQVLLYRELAKLKSTYVDSLPNLVGEDGRIHSHFNQNLTTTGRLSSTDPNLQNIPIRTERGSRVREAFVAAPGKALMSIDYSQIELRILAHYSDDINMIKAFSEGLDIHAATASEVFHVPLNEVTSDMRRTAKAINFGIAYGQGAFGLAENLNISRSESADIIKRYFAKFPGVKEYIDSTIELVRNQGFVSMLSGRRRYIHEIRDKSAMVQKFGERAAINAPIQGTASDIVKKAMIEVAGQVKIPMILQIHDELIFEGVREELQAHQNEIQKIMESVLTLKVPLTTNASLGTNWLVAK